MTEDQARTLWCPFTRVAALDGAVSANRLQTNVPSSPVGSTCAASQCMAWRRASATSGYCGLAGQLTGWEAQHG